MVKSAKVDDLMTVDEYLAGEVHASMRHEFVAGRVYAMAGATARHNLIRLNVAALLNAAVAEPCLVFDGDMKLRIERAEGQSFYYPDVFVACEPGDQSEHVRSDAVLVIEVLSPSTERTDRYEKLTAYSSLPMLKEYALIDQSMPCVEVFRKRNLWRREAYGPTGSVTLESVGYTLTFDQVYRRVVF